jgi:septum formation protein
MTIETIILASHSIDRKALLLRIKIPFKIIPSNISETHYKEKIKDPYILVQKLAKEKALAVEQKVLNENKNSLIIAADTVVVLGQDIMGKAQDDMEAFSILQKLMGRSHLLITGIAVLKLGSNKLIVDYDETEVTFLNLNDEEIWDYIKTREWKGRAGAYSIRERASLFIESIKGSYSNVLGLPVQKLYAILKEEFNVNLFKYNI